MTRGVRSRRRIALIGCAVFAALSFAVAVQGGMPWWAGAFWIICFLALLLPGSKGLVDEVEVSDHAGRVHAALGRRAFAEQPPAGVIDERAVEGRDDLQPAVAGNVDRARRREPARLAGVDVAHELGLRHARAIGRRGPRRCDKQGHHHHPPHAPER